MKDLIACWRSGFKGHQSMNVWNTIPHGLIWCTWKEYNSRTLKWIEAMIIYQLSLTLAVNTYRLIIMQ